MWLVNSIILLFSLFGAFYGCRRKKEWIQELDKQEHKLFFWYPLIQAILSRSKLEQALLKNNHTQKALKVFCHSQKTEEQVILYWYQRFATILMVLVLFNILSLFGTLVDLGDIALMEGRYIVRPDYGEGSSEVELDVTVTKDQKTDQSSSIPDSQEVTISVGERRYTQSEVEELFSKAINYLQENVRGNNPSLESVSENLNLIKTIPGTSINITWLPKDYKLVSSDGSIYNNEVSNEGVNTSIKAVLSYYGIKKEYEMNLLILPRKYNESELFSQKLVEEIKSLSDKTAVDPLLELPSHIESYKLNWKQRNPDTGLSLFILGMAVALLLWLYGERQLEMRVKKRKEQMLMDYPDIVNKFTLLVNAGMTIRQAWIKISEDYNSKQKGNPSTKRYLYEEMLITVRELKLGMPEKTSYEQFGRRVGLIPYIKFSALLSQNLIKGTKGFTDLLIVEATQAFENRKEAAKRLGEEAGTKLLLPMMALLILVFLIIMIPAFMSFQM
jgi:tight adherence protein C